jgi:hypothetical protein
MISYLSLTVIGTVPDHPAAVTVLSHVLRKVWDSSQLSAHNHRLHAARALQKLNLRACVT